MAWIFYLALVVLSGLISACLILLMLQCCKKVNRWYWKRKHKHFLQGSIYF